MKKILITGATGNAGRAVITRLQDADADIIAGCRNPERAAAALGNAVTRCVPLDFETGTFPVDTYDAVFLVRPPHLADADRYFRPFIESLPDHTMVVFLSVQGADTRAYLPHAKIEKVILERNQPHVFIRPSYFMENITTTLHEELMRNKRIFMPSADLKFNWIAIDDIADVAARALLGEIDRDHVTVTHTEWYGFKEIVDTINEECGTDFRYESPNVLRYVAYMLGNGEKLSYTLVMLLLHFLPRFTRPLPVSGDFTEITGRQPTGIREFVRRNRENSLQPEHQPPRLGPHARRHGH